jgi:hypothetical protein
MTLLSFLAERREWIAAHCYTDGEYQRCVHCQCHIEIVGAYISIHEAMFEGQCAGSGRCVRLAVPYCPTCERRPQEHGCFHEAILRHRASAQFN